MTCKFTKLGNICKSFYGYLQTTLYDICKTDYSISNSIMSKNFFVAEAAGLEPALLARVRFQDCGPECQTTSQSCVYALPDTIYRTMLPV